MLLWYLIGLMGISPDPCFIQFTSFGPNDAFGGPSPGDTGGLV